jgi:hypothetical protein
MMEETPPTIQDALVHTEPAAQRGADPGSEIMQRLLFATRKDRSEGDGVAESLDEPGREVGLTALLDIVL